MPKRRAIALFTAALVMLAGCVGGDGVDEEESVEPADDPTTGGGNGTDGTATNGSDGDDGPPANASDGADEGDGGTPTGGGDGGEGDDTDEDEPPPPEEPTTVPWPQDGSFVEYDVRFGGGSPGGAPRSSFDLDVRVELVDGLWHARCEGTVTHEDENGTRTEPYGPVHAVVAPPRVDVPVPENETVTFDGILGCRTSSHNGVLVNETTVRTNVSGEPVDALAWRLERTAECRCQAWEGVIHRDTGLVLSWWFGGQDSFDEGRLTGTDAPIGQGEPHVEDREPPQWPHDGSEARFVAHVDSNGTFPEHADTWVNLTYAGGTWRGTCEGTSIETDPPSNESTRERVHENVTEPPPRVPTNVPPGAVVLVPLYDECRQVHAELTVVAVSDPGTWRAESDDGFVVWDAETGVVREWEVRHPTGVLEGRLAPS